MTAHSSPAPIRLKSLRDHVHDMLRAAIISGKLVSGQKLIERQLAADLEISTSPLKEALRQLENEGLVRTEPRKGTFVCFDARQAEEMNLARAALEGIITRQAARHGTEAHFAILRMVTGQISAAVEAGRPDEVFALKGTFHQVIHQASGCDYLCRLQNAQRMYDPAARIAALAREEVRRKSLVEYERIMRAIVARNEDLAERLMREHIAQVGAKHIKLVFGRTS